ncbi:hypothetical protein [Verrucosispora sp. NA02020]|uniref:hypothetical protein n=1 Tax=Verrucosispora sp. NA02020 TaxID=2742132 RepID=UPI0015911211|nr:hypothetical protein [Verrucosispora sp. NA02020]QKW15420.1 hypothetical protein HUT12_23410 [Verrucosispora sp. NA02020]
MRNYLRSFDPDGLRVIFVIGGLFGLGIAAGLVLWAATGEAGLLTAAAFSAASTAVLGGVVVLLWRAAVRLFPDRKEHP